MQRPRLFFVRDRVEGDLLGVIYRRFHTLRQGAREDSFSKDLFMGVYVVVSRGSIVEGFIETALADHLQDGVGHPGLYLKLFALDTRPLIRGDLCSKPQIKLCRRGFTL